MTRWLAYLLAAMSLASCQAREYERKDYAEMNAIALKSVCVGRLEIDLPEKGSLEWRASFDQADVTRVSPPIQSADTFWSRVESRKEELETLPHRTEGNRLGLYENIGNDAAIVLYRDREHRKGSYMMERYLWLGDRGYLFESGPWPNAVRDTVNRDSHAFLQMVPHDTDGRPQASGFCIDGATVTGRWDVIDASAHVSLPGWPRHRLSVFTSELSNSSQVPDTPGAEDRDFDARGAMERDRERYEHRAQADPGYREEPEYPAQFETLRASTKSLRARTGTEAIWRKGLNNGATIYEFRWINSEDAPSTPDNPSISLEMRVGDASSPGKSLPPEQEIIALWDAVLGSVKPR